MNAINNSGFTEHDKKRFLFNYLSVTSLIINNEFNPELTDFIRQQIDRLDNMEIKNGKLLRLKEEDEKMEEQSKYFIIGKEINGVFIPTGDCPTVCSERRLPAELERAKFYGENITYRQISY